MASSGCTVIMVAAMVVSTKKPTKTAMVYIAGIMVALWDIFQQPKNDHPDISKASSHCWSFSAFIAVAACRAFDSGIDTIAEKSVL